VYVDNKGIEHILDEVISSTKSLYRGNLKKIYLYGSYAQNKNNDDSDIDFAILVDLDDLELKEYEKDLDIIMAEMGYKYMKLVSLVDISYARYNKWVDILPYYSNIKNEGVIIYEQ